ncbi:hypothetical protein UFOVP822_31 [uncultured Caudovirales phage]|uniref:Uncharacterized protein n=1 Tax=uncultured Caudovirales phage TaxID=2100421 RepID=A0A6J5P7W4_9CAUD|nr:hypothetical protein UFOVP822_31 [uncultured Caudovirales phage]
MNALERLDHEIAAAKIRRQTRERQLAEQDQQEADNAHQLIMAAAPEAIREFALPFENVDFCYQVRFDLPGFSILARISKMAVVDCKVQWHWTRRTVWHHVNTLDEALVYGAEQGSQWIDVPPPF